MKNKYIVYRACDLRGYENYEAAEKAAKQNTAQNSQDYHIWQAIAVASAPVPDVEVTKL